MRNIQALFTSGLTATVLFNKTDAWLVQWWWEQEDCQSTNGIGVAGHAGGTPYPNSSKCSEASGGSHGITAMEISDWDDGCNFTIYNASVMGECVTRTVDGSPTPIIWGPYSKEEWIEKDPIVKDYNKTCLPYKDIGAAYQILYSCPPSRTSSSTAEANGTTPDVKSQDSTKPPAKT